jgi:hypothetical protein
VPSLIPSTAISYQHQVGKPVRSEPEQTVRLRISIDSWHLCWVSKAFLLLKDRYVFFLTPKVWSWTPVKWGNLLFFCTQNSPLLQPQKSALDSTHGFATGKTWVDPASRNIISSENFLHLINMFNLEHRPKNIYPLVI